MVLKYQGIVQLDQTLPSKKPKDTRSKRARVSFNDEVYIPSGKSSKERVKEDCRELKYTASYSAIQANEMKHGNFGPIFNAYGLNPGVIGSIDVYSVSVDFCKEQEKMSQEQVQVTFPCTCIMVEKDGILIETFLDATTSIRKVLTEKESNDMVRVWLEGRKQLKAQLQLVQDVMKNPRLH